MLQPARRAGQRQRTETLGHAAKTVCQAGAAKPIGAADVGEAVFNLGEEIRDQARQRLAAHIPRQTGKGRAIDERRRHGSTAAKHRRPLLDEGQHAFAAILGIEAAAIGLNLRRAGGVEILFQRGIERALQFTQG